MTAIYIVRHGNTFAEGEPPRRIGARTDLSLTKSGRDQAQRLGAWFHAQSISFDKVLIGPLARSRQTAKGIMAEQRSEIELELEQADWLNEIDHGPDENLFEVEIVQRIGAAALAAWERQAIAPPGWIVDAEARLFAWQRLFAAARVARTPTTTLIVTSNGAARFALLADAGMRCEVILDQSLKLRTGAWGLIHIEATGTRLVSWDQRPPYDG